MPVVSVISKKIILCPKCGGRGVEDKYIRQSVYESEVKICTCIKCNGSGRVLEIIEHHTLDIEKPDDNIDY